MSDDLLLTLLWFIPCWPAVVALVIPKGARTTVKGFSLGVTVATLLVSIVAYHRYTEDGSAAKASLSDRARNNVLKGSRTRGS